MGTSPAVLGRLTFFAVQAPPRFSPLLPARTAPFPLVDPLFHPDLVPDLQAAYSSNLNINLLVTPYGGHMGSLSSKKGRNKLKILMFGGHGIGFCSGWAIRGNIESIAFPFTKKASESRLCQ